jgi:hypothetical protein
MNLGKYIFGTREEYFDKMDDDTRKRQYLVYNLLTLMFFVLVTISFIAGLIYGLIIFNSWIISIFVGLFLGFVAFILLLLMLFLNMISNDKKLKDETMKLTDSLKKYNTEDLSSLSDVNAIRIVQEQKMKLRNGVWGTETNNFHFSDVIKTFIKVSLLLILSLVVANGLELFMFSSKINESLSIIKNSPKLAELNQIANLKATKSEHITYQESMAEWTLLMLNENPNETFKLINSYSTLQIMEVLNNCIGTTKIVLDILFTLLFLTPLIILKKSKEYAGGAFLREVSLSDISVTYYFHLLSQKKCQEIKKVIETKYNYNSFIKN